jgi:RimJ/RimL family protein N-acetyltransferase
MLRGDQVALRARRKSDGPILTAELYDDVELRSRVNGQAWIPVSPDDEDQPFGVRETPNAAPFTVVTLDTDEIAGAAQLWGIDTHNRNAHLGISLRPAFRGRGFGTDVLRVLIRYAFVTRGLHRLGLETLADNDAMIHAARNAGFTHEGTLRQAAWVNGTFVDEVVFGLMAAETSSPAGHQ